MMQGGLESAMESLGGLFQKFAPEIELAVGIIGKLVEVFDLYVKQNKDMESAMARGGLFTSGAKDAFGTARAAMMPKELTGLNQLGITWERNIAMAGAMTSAGMNIRGTLTGANYANQMAGNRGEFTGGAMGLMQRAVFGGGRVAGMTDAEGVAQVAKLVEQYGLTLDNTEKFFAQLNKDTRAAGMTTTKYIQIIDDVSSHFDRMNKALGQTMGFMRELGRYGAIASKGLHDVMDFLVSGKAQGVGGLPGDIFAAMHETPEVRQARVAGTDAEMARSLDRVTELMATAERQGGQPPDGRGPQADDRQGADRGRPPAHTDGLEQDRRDRREGDRPRGEAGA